MKNSLFILCILAGGIGCGRYLPLPHWMLDSQYSLYVLYLLMFTVGVSIGYDRKTLHTLFHQRLTVFAVPLATIVGTYCGVSLIAPLIDGRSWRECMAVGSGFGYYSLSSVLITQYKGAELGAVALLSNVIREISVLLFTPIMVRYFGKISPICAAGVTSVDTCLPIITQYAGKEMLIMAIVNGILTDISIPFLVMLFIA